MSALTSGPFGPGDRPPAMPSGDFCDRERGDGAANGISTGEAWFGLDGQPDMAPAGNWGDLSWVASRRRRELTGIAEVRF